MLYKADDSQEIWASHKVLLDTLEHLMTHSVSLLMRCWQCLCGASEELAARSFPMGCRLGTRSDGINFHSTLWSSWIKTVPRVVKPFVLLLKNYYWIAFVVQQALCSQSCKTGTRIGHYWTIKLHRGWQIDLPLPSKSCSTTALDLSTFAKRQSFLQDSEISSSITFMSILC